MRKPSLAPRPGTARGPTRLLLAAGGLWIAWCAVRLEGSGGAGPGPAMAPLLTAPAADIAWRWAARLGGVAWLLAASAAALSAGASTARLLRVRTAGGLLRPLALGWGTGAIAQYGLALAGLSFPAATMLLAVAPFALRRPSRPRPALSGWGAARAPAAMALVTLAVAGCAALAAETEFDPLALHDANPLRILGLHKSVAWPFGVADDFPWLWEMIRLPILAAGGEDASRWLQPFLLGGIAVAAGRLALRPLGPAWTWGVAALVATNPFLVRQMVWTKNDLLVAWLALAAFDTALDARAGPRRARAAAAGLLSGFAFVTKYPGGAVIVGAFAALPGPWRRRARLLPGLAGGCALAAAPLLLRNLLVTGDPVFPFLGALGPGPFQASSVRSPFLEHMHFRASGEPGVGHLARALRAAFGLEVPEEGLLRWAAFIPLLAASGRRLPAPMPAAVFAIAGCLLLWTAGPPMVRYLSPVFPLGALLAAAGLRGLPGRWPDRVLLLALGFQMAHALGQPAVTDRLPAGAGLESPARWRDRRLPALAEAARTTAGWMGPHDRLLLHGVGRPALFPPRTDDASFGEALFPPFAAIHASRNARELDARIRQTGWTCLLYCRESAFFWRASFAADPWTAADLARWGDWWTRHAESVRHSARSSPQDGYYELFRIHRAPRPRRTTVLPGVEGWFHRIELAGRAGRPWEARRIMDRLRAAAPEWGAVDAAEATLFHDWLDAPTRRALFARARARGWPVGPDR